jgi:hypothetical protein
VGLNFFFLDKVSSKLSSKIIRIRDTCFIDDVHVTMKCTISVNADIARVCIARNVERDHAEIVNVNSISGQAKKVWKNKAARSKKISALKSD